VFTKAAWEACGGIDNELWYTADWDLWLKLVMPNSVVGTAQQQMTLTINGQSN